MESPDKALRKSQSPDRRRSDRCAEAVSDAARNAKKQTDPGTRRPEEFHSNICIERALNWKFV